MKIRLTVNATRVYALGTLVRTSGSIGTRRSARTYDTSALNGSIRADMACLTLVGSALASKRLTSTTDSCRRDATCITP